MKKKFIELLKDTHRKGVEEVIAYLEKASFFTAPASSGFHLNEEGGLLVHSMNVCKAALMLREVYTAMKPATAPLLAKESVVIAALLHDVCKTNIYRPAKKWRKDEHNRWESYQGYDTDYSRFPVGHGEKSVIMLLRLGLEMTNDEVIAIRWHMGAWNLPFQSFEDKMNLAEAFKHPLTQLLQAADGMAAHILENDEI